METETKAAIKETMKEAEVVAEEVVRHPWVRSLSKLGFYTKGILFIVIGISAVFLAAGLRGGRITDPIGAMAAIAEFSFGRVLLIVLVAGAIGHGLWNILRGFADVDNQGRGPIAIIQRSLSVGIGIFYFILAATAMKIVLSERTTITNGEGEQLVTWVFLSIPLGALVVLIIAIGFFVAAGTECYNGVTGRFLKPYRSWQLSPLVHKLVLTLGVVSFLTRAVLYVLMGYFFFLAANLNDPYQAEGIDGALLALARSSYGGILLLGSGFGLVCHGVLAFFEAKYRRIC
jgi:hypothetical protein